MVEFILSEMGQVGWKMLKHFEVTNIQLSKTCRSSQDYKHWDPSMLSLQLSNKFPTVLSSQDNLNKYDLKCIHELLIFLI